MKKYIWLGFSFLWSWQVVAQQEIPLPERQAMVLQRCLLDRGMLNRICGGDEHPNLFEHPRFAPALQKFLSPTQYQLLIDKGNFIFQKPEYNRNRLDMAIGFCPPASSNQHENIHSSSCPDILVISFRWETPLNEIAKSYSAELDHALQTPDLPKNQQPLSPPMAMSSAILGPDGQGGKLQILYVTLSHEAAYWQDGMAEKALIKTDSELFEGDAAVCGSTLTEKVAECMQALEKAFASHP